MLLRCSGVGRTAVVVQTAYVAYAYAVGVMFQTVGTDARNWATLLPLAIRSDDVVEPDIRPMLFVLVVLPYLFDPVAVDGLGS